MKVDIIGGGEKELCRGESGDPELLSYKEKNNFTEAAPLITFSVALFPPKL